MTCWSKYTNIDKKVIYAQHCDDSLCFHRRVETTGKKCEGFASCRKWYQEAKFNQEFKIRQYMSRVNNIAGKCIVDKNVTEGAIIYRADCQGSASICTQILS